jgi:prepilin-type N-terminal cleavage/methylation domain-containing protein
LRHIARRRAFTLVELLVVIGIILVLIAIVVAGIRHTSYLAAKHETAAELKVCEDLLKEYQAINGMKNIEGPANTVTPDRALKLPNPTWLNHEYRLPIYIDPTPALPNEVTGTQPQTALGIMDFKGSPPPPTGGQGPRPSDAGDMSDNSSGNNPRWVCNAVYNTQGIMFILLKDPKNRALVSALSSNRILETWAPFAVGGAKQPPFTIDAAVPLDAWGNPIIFVPRGGMHVVMDPTSSGTLEEYIIRTSGTYRKIGVVPPVGPNDHPFFASAGPDNYFNNLLYQTASMAKFDRSLDNIYSFQAP